MSILALVLAVTASSQQAVTFRLHPQAGQVFDFSLSVKRKNPNESGELREKVKIASVSEGVVTMEIRMNGLTIDGIDRSKELKEIWGDQVVTMPWTELGDRTGEMSPLRLKPGGGKIMSYLGEAGLYMCSFKRRPVQEGASWLGATTATGGCTSGQFSFKGISTKDGKRIANFEVSNIAMGSSTQIGPMKLTVDPASGMPMSMIYSVRDNATGRRLTFEQTVTLEH